LRRERSNWEGEGLKWGGDRRLIFKHECTKTILVLKLHIFFSRLSAFVMATNNREHKFLNNLLYVESVKFHRGRYNKKTLTQIWNCSYAKKRKCSCHATTKLIKVNTASSTISGSECEKSESDDSEADYDLDPRLDLENYKEILITCLIKIENK